jgi:serine protease
VSGSLIDGGLCDKSSNNWSGKVVLCERGEATFNEKVANVQQGGGKAAVVYNNAAGNFLGTLGEGNSSTIPAISLDQESGQFLVNAELGASGTVVSTFKKPASGYATLDGTSFSAPHVSGIAALIWSFNPNWTNADIRTALEKTAKDLGKKGKDKSYGHGLVQAAAALQWLQTNRP